MAEKGLEIGKTLFDVGISLFRRIFTDKFTSPETGEKLKEFEQERSSIFGEGWESILAHKFPTLGKLMDLASFLGLRDSDLEEHPFQNEFEGLSALTLLIPDFLLRRFTDPIREQRWFQVLVKAYPLDAEIEQDIQTGNPDAIINFIRMVHQDLISAKVGISGILDRIQS